MRSIVEIKQELMTEAIDRLITVDFHSRGIVTPVYDVLRKKIGKPLTYQAAQGLVKALTEPNDVVLIGTGFLIKPSFKPETDGPIAAVLLARALNLYGAKPIIVAEEGVMPCLRGASVAAELLPYEGYQECLNIPHSVGLVTYPADKEASHELGAKMLKDLKPKAMVTVEHPGANGEGKYNDGLGGELDPWVAPIDTLLTEVRKSGGFTVSIGDYGNECGMGNAKPEIDELIPFGPKIASVVESDAPVMSVISEFGAYGVIAALQVLSGKKVLHDTRVQEAVTRQAVLHGAIEGCTKIPTPALDMVDIHYCNAFIEMLHTVLIYTEEYSAGRPFFLEFLQSKEK